MKKAHTLFVLPWTWNGREAVLQSRCTDERGDVQPSLAEIASTVGRHARLFPGPHDMTGLSLQSDLPVEGHTGRTCRERAVRLAVHGGGIGRGRDLGAGAAAQAQTPDLPDIGRTPTDQEIRQWDIAIGPSGKELPPGRGTAKVGAAIYAAKCLICHGPSLEGTQYGSRLVGSKATLTTSTPMRTVGSFWAYATTLWDYINRAMPRAPFKEGSLTANEVYALTAFVLYKNGIVKERRGDRRPEPAAVQMPNRDGFLPAQAGLAVVPTRRAASDAVSQGRAAAEPIHPRSPVSAPYLSRFDNTARRFRACSIVGSSLRASSVLRDRFVDATLLSSANPRFRCAAAKSGVRRSAER